MSKQKGTAAGVGTSVLYFPAADEQIVRNGEQPLHAVVAGVTGEGQGVNLSVTDALGNHPVSRTHVPLFGAKDKAPEDGSAYARIAGDE